MVNNINSSIGKVSLQERFSEINPFSNPDRENAELLEDYFQDKAEVFTDRLTKGRHGERTEKFLDSVPPALGKSVGEIIDKAVECVEDVKKAAKSNTENIEAIQEKKHDNAIKHALCIAGSGIAGGVGVAVAAVKVVTDTLNTFKQESKQAIYNSIDNIEGTSLRKLDDEKSITETSKKKIKDKSKEIEEKNKLLGTTTSIAGSVALDMFAKPVMTLADTGRLVHDRMGQRALAKGIDYSDQKENIREQYELTDKRLGDKVKYVAKNIERNIKKVTDVKVGDIVRLAFAVWGITACITNIVNIVSYVDKAGDVISAIANNENVMSAITK